MATKRAIFKFFKPNFEYGAIFKLTTTFWIGANLTLNLALKYGDFCAVFKLTT